MGRIANGVGGSGKIISDSFNASHNIQNRPIERLAVFDSLFGQDSKKRT